MPAHVQTQAQSHVQTQARTDLEIDRAAHTIRLTRSFDASRAEIFEGWTKPEHVSQWWDPAGQPLVVCEIDLRLGGAFTFTTKARPDMPFTGIYREIAPPDRLVFEALAATGRVMLQDVAGKTKMTVEIECHSAEQLDQYLKMGIDVGTSQTLDNLVAFMRR
ncbi:MULTISPECIES: SRPBCC domain-containing protein [unclassified Beijerinckia]|uniref:SRPBCC domain-containing protein n=1 Tax=unclassified Beijerinckia TaxID=2638183 RepID=UPI00089B7D28|nr:MULTISPECIES: SRPBCC domain-containing protein [unclassified Beijerinckia]MDH7794922.1 uncharacterized protein YndB with AHSA1/START domain [Beijerinckia sp. GAS462]SEB80522.1 Uncharacterized conserved protein YndB, AHSA1/START domain [Beijerinckia sp. 28-YEA-48]